MKQQISFTILSPGGNTTALVEEIPAQTSTRPLINDTIMRACPEVEQVGFLDRMSPIPRLQMAGGEFCGNATRSAACLHPRQ